MQKYPTALMADALRILSMDAVEAANSGHPGMPMGMADVAATLFTRYLRYDPSDPAWPDRDRFVLSAGHGSMLLYALMHLSGYAQPTIDEIRNFRQLGSPCAGHPENFELPGVECTTGPLGQGLAMAVGMAIAERHLNAIYGDYLVDHRTWVIAGDGCLMEGINHEAIGLAGHLKLGRLIVFWDDNRITIDGPTSLSTSEDIPARYSATGWQVLGCNGHDFESIITAIDGAIVDESRPTLIRCRTVIGKGAPNKQGSHKVHGSPLGPEELAASRANLGWSQPAFGIPENARQAWLAAGCEAAENHARWKSRLASHPRRDEFNTRLAGKIGLAKAAEIALDDIARGGASVATRKSSELALEKLTAAFPQLIGGSADLTPSNNTKTPSTTLLTAQDYAGRYLHYGIREFGMAAAMNGLALHGGIVPFGGTFLIFSDYARAAIRLSALQGARVIYVMTHDSIGLGEDGPTHQPIEQIMSLRLIPNLEVWRPCDSVETAEAWAHALSREHGPSLIALSRQNLTELRTADAKMLFAGRGAYRIHSAVADRRVVLVATGSEVGLAMDVASRLEAIGMGADVVSMPCWSRFDAQPLSYRADILPDNILRVSIEAGTTIGWERYTGLDGLRFGIDRFGASGPAEKLYEYFGLTADVVFTRIVECC